MCLILSALLSSIPTLFLIPAYAAVDSSLVSGTSLEGADVQVEALGPIKFDEPNQPIPYLANGTDYTFIVSFFEPNSRKLLKDVNYNIVITDNPFGPGNELFNAAKQANDPSNMMLHSATGNATVKYNFNKPQTAILRIQFYGTANNATSSGQQQPQQHDFEYQVIDSKAMPEFPLIAVVLASSLVAAIVVARTHIKKP
ncbi:hypothetical protein NTE_01805 [Candidatus Nitrososphaera evergladensis SR1]|uniref:Uncharacterized protein n=2 Tax=Nitrososphaera TaxID=497726 RepID=A0A075MQQ2_9ARCH|nr:hypothetical protein NTE_01805 [Candidatus Nitrososphaera evergladensis SR1]